MDKNIKDIIKASYENNASIRDRAEVIGWKVDVLDDYLAVAHENNVKTVLDFGSGAGQYAKYLEKNGMDMTCIDLADEMVKLCESKGLKARQMDFYNIEFEDDSFDSVWAMSTLPHVPKKSLGHVLDNMKRIVKNNGIIFIGVYGGKTFEGIWEEDFYEPKRFFSFFEDEDMKSFIANHFEIIDFNVIEDEDGGLNYQSMILRNKKQ